MNEVGAIESPDTEIELTNLNSRSWYIGYFLTEKKSIQDVIPDELLEYPFIIKHEKWAADFDPLRTPQWKTRSILSTIIHPGEMIELAIKETDTFNFKWKNIGSTKDIIEDFPETQYFTFEREQDYLPFYIEIEEGNQPEEIAVFLDGECKGASVVDDFDGENILSQINVYLLEEEMENFEDEIEIIMYYGENKGTRKATEYAVYNTDYNQYFKTKLRLKDVIRKESVFLSLKSDDINNDVPPVIEFKLDNYPNPFNPTTTIIYSLPKDSDMSLSIFNLKGQKVKTLYTGKQIGGAHKATWNGTDNFNNKTASGVYFYKLTAGKKTASKKMLLLK